MTASSGMRSRAPKRTCVTRPSSAGRPLQGNTRNNVRISDPAGPGPSRSAIDAEDGVRLAAAAADARRHRSAAARDARVRRDAPGAQARGLESRRRGRVPRFGARRRSPAAHQAICRKRRYVGPPRGASLAGASGDEPGIPVRLPDDARAGARRIRQPALEACRSAAFRAPDPLLRYRRQAARVPLRALDPGKVDRAAQALHARDRARCRARSRAAR